MSRRTILKVATVGPPTEGRGIYRSATIDAVQTGGGSGAYTTTFPNTEANLSESGVWTIGDNGGTNSSTGPQTTGGSPGVCFAHAADAADYLGFIQSRFSTSKHYAQMTVKRVGGYTPPDTHEISLYVGATLASGVSQGYELDFGFPGSTLQAVRWNNGATGSYDFGAVTTVSGSWSTALTDGDLVKAVYDSSSGSPVMTVSLNGVDQIVLTDTTGGKITSGSPGVGFFVRAGATLTSYAIKGFAADSA